MAVAAEKMDATGIGLGPELKKGPKMRLPQGAFFCGELRKIDEVGHVRTIRFASWARRGQKLFPHEFPFPLEEITPVGCIHMDDVISPIYKVANKSDSP